MGGPSISIVIPVLNEADEIGSLLAGLVGDSGVETIVVDGGSGDATAALAMPLADRVIETGRGRARQMNAGAGEARGDILLFLHADTRLPTHFAELLRREFDPSDHDWGRFDVKLSGRDGIFRLIERMMNLRSRLTGVCTGDQALFVRRRVFEQIGGFAEMPLMEDIDISVRLKSRSRPLCLAECVVTSSRRWEENGPWRTIVLMWWLRLRYFLGASPESLVERYYR